MYRGKHVSLLIILAAVLAGLLNQGCVTAGEYDRLKAQLAEANETIDLKDQRIEEVDSERLYFEEECLALKDQMANQEDNTEKYEKQIAELKEQLNAGNANKTANIEGVEFYNPKGQGVGIRVSDEVLFDSGSHTLKPAGKTLLSNIARNLMQSSGLIKVIGHTDNDPVRKTKNKYPRGNIQLSAERSISVYEYLKSSGVPAERMCVVGYGESQPLTPNTTSDSKQRNRRVEIELLN